ncbi:uncharacterized protein LOC125074519 [Vanessa atalanta]|uniref:uncharacterized protein LOC125074519 n=1 Tax=Vanessa atalanta TaxID=42275 RepID=UPI001FCD19E7|nr:uncharacterized protein LOC125074519 [Vanessa atalanta]
MSFNNETAGDSKNQVRVSTDPSRESCRVGVRIPPFWPQEPALWFAQVEGQFALANITADATKFNYVTAQLDHVYAAEVKDIIIAPPETNKYEKLKTELTKRLSASREKEVQQLLMHEELGDRKPSQFLRHLQHLAGPNIPEDFLKTIWTSRLPNSIQAVLVAQPTTPLATLAEVADRVNDVVPRTPVVASTSTSTQNALDHMAKMISELTKQVQALTTHASRKPRPISRGRDERKGSSADRILHTENTQPRGKRSGQSLMATDDYPSSSRLFVTDRNTKTQFLIDTGSDICVYPRVAIKERRPRTNYQLFAANGTVINTYYKHLELDIGLRRNFTWRFVVADVTKAIIGVDFLSFYNLAVDCRHKRLIDNVTTLQASATSASRKPQSWVASDFGRAATGRMRLVTKIDRVNDQLQAIARRMKECFSNFRF